MLNYFKKLKPWQKIIFALVGGIVTGLICGERAAYLKPIGSLFINAIHMMIVPVVFTAIVCAVLSMDDPQKMRRVGAKAIVLYAMSMAIAAIISLTVAALVAPGAGLQQLTVKAEAIAAPGHLPTLTEAIVNMVPENALGAFVSGNILQILVFALILGVSINLAGEAAKPVANLFRAFSVVATKLTELVMSFAPYGIFALMAWVSGEYGIAALIPLIKLVLSIYACCFLLAIIFYAPTLALIAKISPLQFFRAISDAMLLAFSTSSSAATLPVTMRCAEEGLGISKKLGGFLLPLGTTMNLNGLSIYLSVATVFAANMYGVELNFIQYLTIVFTIILTSMGAGGVPGSGIIVMSAVMSSVGLPLGAISLIAGVDRLNDMAQTTTNVVGDLYAAFMIAKSEGELGETANLISVSSE
jgi:Na+/H+-dicarboxylate symporter